MTTDERMMKAPDERLTTTSPRETEDIRGHTEEAIVDHSATAATPTATVSGPESARQKSQPAPSRKEGRIGGVLFDEAEAQQLRIRWTEIQSSFVDEPRRAVKEADGLVVDMTTRLTDRFAKERTGLERQWDRGDDVTTEDLRVTLQRYRTFFDRLLAV
jgi:hypothetical protein